MDGDRRGSPGLGLAAETVGRMAYGMVYSRLLYAAASLGIADHLRSGPRTTAELARVTDTHAPSLGRLLRALVACGIFSRQPGSGGYSLNALGETLCQDSPRSLKALVLHLGADWQVRTWSDILYSVRTGAAAFDRATGCSIFEYLACNPHEAMLFNQVMGFGTALAIPEILAAYDFSHVTYLMDVGGGNGALLAAVLKSNPRARGALLECAEGIRGARGNSQLTRFGSRVSLCEGDFFVAVPGGADIYVLKHVLHDWSDEQALKILKNCRDAMTASARLVIAEMAQDDKDPNDPGGLLDLAMLLTTGGRERSIREYQDMCGRAGLGIKRIASTSSGRYSLIEAAPV